MSEKTQGEELREKLFYEPKNLSETMTPEEKQAAEAFSEIGRASCRERV